MTRSTLYVALEGATGPCRSYIQSKGNLQGKTDEVNGHNTRIFELYYSTQEAEANEFMALPRPIEKPREPSGIFG